MSTIRITAENARRCSRWVKALIELAARFPRGNDERVQSVSVRLRRGPRVDHCPTRSESSQHVDCGSRFSSLGKTCFEAPERANRESGIQLQVPSLRVMESRSHMQQLVSIIPPYAADLGDDLVKSDPHPWG